MRHNLVVGIVLLRQRYAHPCKIGFEVPENGIVVRATPTEYALLDKLILAVGIAVQSAQSFLRKLIVHDVLLHVLVVVDEHAADIHRERQTDVAVDFCAVVEDENRHRRQRVDERVVARNLQVAVGDVLFEGQRLLAEFLILRLCLMTGVSQLEDIVGLLRIQHDGILAASLHDVAHGLKDFLTHGLRV